MSHVNVLYRLACVCLPSFVFKRRKKKAHDFVCQKSFPESDSRCAGGMLLVPVPRVVGLDKTD